MRHHGHHRPGNDHVDKVCFFVPQIIPPTGLPLLIDGDTGCGEARNVMPMIRSFKDVGAAAVTNRGPWLPGKRGPLNDNKVADLHDMAARIAAAQRARAELHATIEYHDYEALNASIVTTTTARATPRRG